MKKFKIGKKWIGDKCPALLIFWEVGVNYNGSIERGYKLIEEFASSGADIVKFLKRTRRLKSQLNPQSVTGMRN